jgi:hypothetical protein
MFLYYIKEFVIDLDPENKNKIPRFLIYDIIKFEVRESKTVEG